MNSRDAASGLLPSFSEYVVKGKLIREPQNCRKKRREYLGVESLDGEVGGRATSC